MFAHLLKAPVVMVPNIPVGLPQLLGDFFEGMPFEEMQSECFPLIFGERLEHSPPAISPEQTFDTLVVVCAFSAINVATFDLFVLNSGCIEAAGF